MQFFQLFPSLRKNDFYVTGESYAGKYVPAVSYKIHTQNKLKVKTARPRDVINLKVISYRNLVYFTDSYYREIHLCY